ncbi:MAG: 50S ribosomal protein L15 [Lentimicrobium sp.]|jgi:large subunit ribosomal protein L15|nr:50S ribosomal protein L15 [Lentimicrobium sp.]
MDLSSLKPAEGSVKSRKRIGRGQGSGRGGTSTRGHKGAKSRSGYSQKIGFEGGQMPLYRRVPKYGFRNINRVEYRSINIDIIQHLAATRNVEVVDMDLLIENGYVSKNDKVKILGRGELTAKVEVRANAFSASAIKAIESKGGQAIKI